MADIIVVGAGGSGAPLASRLADRGANVILLESGPVASPLGISETFSLAAAIPGHPMTATYHSELTPGRSHQVVRGIGAGGSTAANASYFRRPRSHDLDGWAAEVDDNRWSSKSTNQLWIDIENDREFGAFTGHGQNGPIPISRGDLMHPLSQALLDAGVHLGLPLELDKNSTPDCSPGVGATPTNTLNGKRVSTAHAYLAIASELRIGSLRVLGGHKVMSVVTRNGRAIGVRVKDSSQFKTLFADLIVLSAGAIGTPHILMLSGIGPAKTLHELGVDVVVEAPAVGMRLDDHPNVTLSFSVRPGVLGVQVENPIGVSLHTSSGVTDDLHESIPGDLEVLSFLKPLGQLLTTNPIDQQLSLLVSPLRRSTFGRLEFDNRDLEASPHLHFDYLSSNQDKARMRAAIRFAARLIESEAMRDLGAVPDQCHLAELDDADLDCWAVEHLSTAYHTCGTTAMGTDPLTSVVDGRGAVHGIAGLHVADVGILPRTPTGGTAAAAVLIGEVMSNVLG